MRVCLSTVAVLVCVVAGGCGTASYPTATLEGSVTVDGRAIEQGAIYFTPLESERGTAVTAEISEGRYTASDVPLGRVRVLFHSVEPTGRMLTDPDSGEEYPETVSLIADEYQTRGVEIEVSEGAQTKDFELTSE